MNIEENIKLSSLPKLVIMLGLKFFTNFILPSVIFFVPVFFLTFAKHLNPLEFLGVVFSLFSIVFGLYLLYRSVYNTWVGVFLGHNVKFKDFGSWAVVTGATDGIGKAYTRELAQRGINVVLISRTQERLLNCARELESEFHIQAKVITFDFTNEIDQYETIEEELEGMDIGTLINNVGMTYSAPMYFDELPQQKDFIHDMININILAVTMMTRIILPGMLDRGKGVIVNVGSAFSCNEASWFSLYGASKAYMDKFTDDLRREYKDRGIIFQYQMPGYVATKISKIRNANMMIPSPEQYARWGMKSVGLQKRTAVWLPHRALVYILSPSRLLFETGFDDYATLLFKSFWIFGKKKELEKNNVVIPSGITGV